MRRTQAGFTFLEMLIVLAIVAVGAAIVIPKVTAYMLSPRQEEALIQLEKIRVGAAQYYAKNGRFPVGTATTLPEKRCCDYVDNKCPVTPKATWTADAIWGALGFAIVEPNLFQYSYISQPDTRSFTAVAIGDLDCDGTQVTYTLRGATNAAGTPTFEIQKPARFAE